VERSVLDGLLVESWAYASLQNGPEFMSWLGERGRRVRPLDETPRVRVDDHGETVDIVLTRRRLRNLLDSVMRDQLVDALKAVGAGTDRPVFLRAEGPAFCAGGDTAEFGTVSDPATAHAVRATANVAPWLHRVADRTTAVIEGPCVGAGVELAAVCARVEATRGARFRLPETRMGLIPGAGGTVSIPRRIGPRRTLEWLLTGDEIDATTALTWGLVDEIMPD
jgi:enoyl-CoA hydratase/carnithine racemase